SPIRWGMCLACFQEWSLFLLLARYSLLLAPLGRRRLPVYLGNGVHACKTGVPSSGPPRFVFSSVQLNVTLCRELCRKLCRRRHGSTKFTTNRDKGARQRT